MPDLPATPALPAGLKRFDLSGRLALVTGSSQGIGLALAGALGSAGAAVVLNGRRAEPLERAQTALRGQGITAHVATFDVTDSAAVDAAIERIEAETGAIDILVNNAGMQHRGAFTEFPDEAWARLMRTNIDSVFYVGRAVARRMAQRRRGRIINIGSVQCELGRPNITPYAATKGAVKMLTKGMATELGPLGLQVNAIAPGYFKTELTQALVADAAFSEWLARRTPAGRWGEVDELAGAAIFLASDAASFVNGHLLAVDGGITACL